MLCSTFNVVSKTFYKVTISSQLAYNVPYKNSAAIAGDDFPQENQTQQVRTDFRFDTVLALFLYSVVQRFFN